MSTSWQNFNSANSIKNIPAGNVTAHDVQAAINELDTEKQSVAGLGDYTKTLAVADVIAKGPLVDVRAFGAVGDGVTDDTAAIQAAIEHASIIHGTAITHFGKTYIVDNLVVDGKSDFGIEFNGVLKRPDNLAPQYTINATPPTMTIKNCNNAHVKTISFDGNALNNHCDPAANPYDPYNLYWQEVRHCLTLDNCIDCKFDHINGLNPSGDVVFITGADTSNLVFGTVYGKATAAIGRNTVSIVEGKHIYIKSIFSDGVGHFLMPGGLDIEPESGQYVEDVHVNRVSVITGAASGLNVGCQYGGGSQIKNVTVNDAVVNNTNTLVGIRIVGTMGSTNVSIGNLIINGKSTSTAVVCGVSAGIPQPAYNFVIDNLVVDGCSVGLLMDLTHGGKIKANVKNCYTEMAILYGVENFDFDLRGTFHADATTGYCVRHAESGTLNNCRFSGDLSKASVGAKGAYCFNANRGDSQYVVDCELIDLNMSGWAYGTLISKEYDNAKRSNCGGLTDANVYTGLEIASQTLPPIGTALDSCTWAQIALISALGLGDVYFNVGDEKTVVLSTSEGLSVQIYDFNHDILGRDSNKKAGITFGTKHLMASPLQVNAENTNVGGWKDSALKSWMDNVLIPQFPSDLQVSICDVLKFSSVGNGSSSLSPTLEKVFLFSEIELFGALARSIAGEGTKYTIFTDANSLIKKLSNGAGIASIYFQRSPDGYEVTTFCAVSDTGTATISNASAARGIAFGFCV